MAKMTKSYLVNIIATFGALNFFMLLFLVSAMFFYGMLTQRRLAEMFSYLQGKGVLISLKEKETFDNLKSEAIKSTEKEHKAGKEDSQNDLWESQLKSIEERKANIRREMGRLDLLKAEIEADKELIINMRKKMDKDKFVFETNVATYRDQEAQSVKDRILKQFNNMEAQQVARSLLGISDDPKLLPPKDIKDKIKLKEFNNQLDYLIQYLDAMNVRMQAAVMAELGPVWQHHIDKRRVARVKNLTVEKN